MDPGSNAEVRLDIDPNAFQLALRSGILTLVPRTTPAANVPLIQPPPTVQPAAATASNANNQLTLPSSSPAFGHALTMHYASQNSGLNDTQYHFLKEQLNVVRAEIANYEQHVDQRRSFTLERERMAQANRARASNAFSSTGQVNQPTAQPMNGARSSTSTNHAFNYNQGMPYNQAGGSNGAAFHPSYQQAGVGNQSRVNPGQNAYSAPNNPAAGSTSMQYGSSFASTSNQFQNYQPPQQISISESPSSGSAPRVWNNVRGQRAPPTTLPTSNVPSTSTVPQASTQNNDKARTSNSMFTAPPYQHQTTSSMAVPNSAPAPAFNPGHNTFPRARQQIQASNSSYANLYYNSHPQGPTASTFPSQRVTTQAQSSSIPSASSQTAARAETMKQSQPIMPPLAPAAASTSTHRPIAPKPVSAPYQIPKEKLASPLGTVNPAPPLINRPSTPQRVSPVTPSTVSPIKKEEGSVAKALLNLFGKRKAPEASPSDEPASKRRATTPRASTPSPAPRVQLPEPSNGSSSMPQKPRRPTSNSIAADDKTTSSTSNMFNNVSDTTVPVPPVNTVLPFGELNFESDVVFADPTHPLFEGSVLAGSDAGDSNLPRIEVLSDDVSIPPPSRSPSLARQSSVPVVDVLEEVDNVIRDVNMNGMEAFLEEVDHIPLSPAVARSPSEPLFLPLTSDDEAVEKPKKSSGKRPGSIKEPRWNFLCVQVPVPKGFPNPIRNGPRLERARKKRLLNVIHSSDEEAAAEKSEAVGPPRKAPSDGYEQILKSADAARLAPRSCEWSACEAVLDSLQKLEKHVKIAHISSSKDSDKMVCRWRNCHKGEFKDHDELTQHVRKHLGSRRDCMHLDCNYSTRSAYSLASHIRDQHNGDMSLLKPFVNDSLAEPPIFEDKLPHMISTSKAFGGPVQVQGHPDASLEARPPSPPTTPQSLAIMPLSPTKYAHRSEDEKERVIDKYSFLDPLWPPRLVMDELSGYGLDIFLAECSAPEASEQQQRAASVDELLF